MNLPSSEPPHLRAASAELTDSERHRLLSSGRRRVLLEVLAERHPPADLDGLAAAVVERDDGDRRTASDASRVAIDLHHCHLPMLAEAGVVEYDPSEKRVETVRRRPGLS